MEPGNSREEVVTVPSEDGVWYTLPTPNYWYAVEKELLYNDCPECLSKRAKCNRVIVYHRPSLETPVYARDATHKEVLFYVYCEKHLESALVYLEL